MSALAIILLAVATCFAAGTALWIALAVLHTQRAMQQQKASVLRAQLIAQLQVIKEAVVPRGRGLDLLQKEIYEPLQYLWMQADLLEPDEIQIAHRCSSALLALRHKPSVNQTQARHAHKLIDEACSALMRSQAAIQQQHFWFFLPGLAKSFPGLRSLDINGSGSRDESGVPNRVGLLKN
ncbi:MAG: hypothetical protein AB7G68_03715 [Nitrospiraceae bacterium]